ncbi:hypothetical protein [Nocardia lijiangensis]|uniref:hypothetical protein n=1 Tax=Nocardia lijiangensis TaxID=299618 RepID=UPI000830E7E9|nr:hypothetical protein [Nocardia lijiangensis]
MAAEYTYGTATEVSAESPVDTGMASGGSEYTAAASTAESAYSTAESAYAAEESAYAAEEVPVETPGASVLAEEPDVDDSVFATQTEPVIENTTFEPDVAQWPEEAPVTEQPEMIENSGLVANPDIERHESPKLYPDEHEGEPYVEDYEHLEYGTDSDSEGMQNSEMSEQAPGAEEIPGSEPVDVGDLPNGPFYVDISDVEDSGSVADPLGEASPVDPSEVPGIGDVMTSIQDVVTQLGSVPGFENAHTSLQDVFTQLNDIPGLGGLFGPASEDGGDSGTGIVDFPGFEQAEVPEGVDLPDLGPFSGSEDAVDALSSVLPGEHDIGDPGIDPTQIPGLGDVITNLQDVMTQLGEVPGLEDTMSNLQDVMTQLGQIPGLEDIATELGGIPGLEDVPGLDDLPGADQLPLDELPLDQLPLDELPLDQLPLDQIPVDQIPGGEYLDYAQNAEQYGTEIIENLEETFGPEDLLDPNGGVIEAAQESSLGYDMLNDNIGGALDTADEVLGDGAGQTIYDVVETMGDLNGITSAVASASPIGWGLSAYNFIDDGGIEDVYNAGSDAVDWVDGAATDAADWVDGAATDAADWAEEAVDDVGDAVSDAGEAIGSVVSDIGDFFDPF